MCFFRPLPPSCVEKACYQNHRLHTMMAANTTTSTHEALELVQKKEGIYQCPDYLDDADATGATAYWIERTHDVRRHNINFMFSTVEKHGIDREVVITATNILDRCLAEWMPNFLRGHEDLPYELDIICIVALFIAIKSMIGRHCYTMIPPIETLLPQYSKKRFDEVEVHILFALKWNILYPTPLSIVRDLFKLLPNQGLQKDDRGLQLYKRSIYLETLRIMENVTLEYDFLQIRPTTIALASILSAIDHIIKFTRNEVLHFNDTLSLFKEAVETHLGDINISCDNADVQRCLERIRGHQAPRTRSSPRRCPPSSPTGVKGFANESSHQHTSKTD